ncbi:hypothetical protein JMG10_27835 [Nostoc ellipsosporum NOK]|nr:hypothetical protein [Nostoc ellipsosporum NOK]
MRPFLLKTIPTTMLRFKKIDIAIQLLLIVPFLFFGLFINSPFFVIGYFVVGGWQVTSFFIHLYHKDKFTPAGGRKVYGKTIAAIAGIALGLLALSLLIEEFGTLTLIYLFLLLFITPVIACWYWAICMNEVDEIIGRTKKVDTSVP